VPSYQLPEGKEREGEWFLPQLAEVDLSRHYTELAKRVHGVNDGFYPLGSCTMKYNPQINEQVAGLAGFTGIHPLQPISTVQGCLSVMAELSDSLCEITGMDAVTLQPAAGAHGEFTGLLLIKAWLADQGQTERKKIIVPDSAHGTNPASAAMAGFEIVNIPSGEDGCVDLEALRAAVGADTAGLMLTNPNTVGIFDKNILEITAIVHQAGGLCYYDGANLNAIMGTARPGDMGFDVVHVNLHKTFSTPHGGGGPGAGAVGCKEFLKAFLPDDQVEGVLAASAAEAGVGADGGGSLTFAHPEKSIGRVKAFYGNFLVAVRALTYIQMLGREGVVEASSNAVLNANYMRVKLQDTYDMAYPGLCMHEFVMSLEKLHHEKEVSALDVAKMLLDYGIHPPTMYFPLIVHEALMVEPTETESKDTLDQAIAVFKQIYEAAMKDPAALHQCPTTTPVGRLDEVQAARNPVLRYVPAAVSGQ
jgi:glycine dehydrogenase subunit 2